MLLLFFNGLTSDQSVLPPKSKTIKIQRMAPWVIPPTLPQHWLVRIVCIFFTGFEGRDRVRLPRHGQDALPGSTTRIHGTRGRGHQFGNGHECHAIVAQADGKSGVARHGTMYGILTQLHAVQGIGSIGGDGPHGVRRIYVFARGNLSVLGKVLGDGVFHEFANGRKLLVATGVSFCGRSHQLFTRSLLV